LALTDNCDLYGAVHEDGFNLLIRHFMRQRPSWFNFGTSRVAMNPKLWCVPIKPEKVVVKRNNPLMAVEDPLQLPLLGTNAVVALDFCVQIEKLEIDFHPGNVIALPPELAPPLAAQRFALHGRVCASIGCPSDRLVEMVEPPPPLPPPKRGDQDQGHREPPNVIMLPGDDFDCFCLDLFVVGHFEITGSPGAQRLEGKLDGLEIVDIEQGGLESTIECYLEIVTRLVFLPHLRVPLTKLVFDLLDLVTITLTPTPTSPALPNNPAVEDDQVKVFIDFGVGP